LELFNGKGNFVCKIIKLNKELSCEKLRKSSFILVKKHYPNIPTDKMLKNYRFYPLSNLAEYHFATHRNLHIDDHALLDSIPSAHYRKI